MLTSVPRLLLQLLIMLNNIEAKPEGIQKSDRTGNSMGNIHR
jgi:hypothetical protein